MSKKVILSAVQSGKAGVFSDQLLTRLMVIFLHRHRFYCKILILASFICHFYSSLSICFCSLHLLSLWLLYLLLHIICFSMLTPCCPHYPPHAATKCSCFELIQIKRHIFRARFLASVSWYSFHHTHIQTIHSYIHKTETTSHYQFNSFIRILQ